MLEPGNGKTKTGRLRVYVRDDRSSADMTPSAVWFAYTPDRKGIHPRETLASFSGTLRADAYGGYQAIYETGRVREAACWAHARRQFYELHTARPNALNTEALERIGALYKIEDAIRGKPPDERRAYRQEHARASGSTSRMAGRHAGDALKYLRFILARIADHAINRVDQLMPWVVADQLSGSP